MEDKSTKRITLIMGMLTAFLAPFDISSVNIAIPTIGSEFSMAAVSVGWVSTAYLLASTVFLVPFGRLADIHGRKKIYTAGISVFTLASFLTTLCTSSGMLIGLRVLQGFGTAMIFGTIMALVTSIFSPQERGKALGTVVASSYLGFSTGPFLGGVLINYFGWRSIFFVNVPIGIAIILLVIFRIKGEWAEAKNESFDLAGSLLFCLSITALMIGFSSFAKLGVGPSLCLIFAGLLGMFIFARWEMRSEHPVLNINLFISNKTFTFSNLASLINYSATYSITFFLSLYLQHIKNFDPQTAGTILISQPIVMTIGSPFAGRLSDRIEPRIVSSIGMALIALGLFLLALLNNNTSLIFIIMVLILIGAGFALFSSPNSNAIMSSVDKKFYGIASGMQGTMRLTGQMLSMGITILILAIYLGHAQITPEYYPAFLSSTRSAFILFGILCIFGVFASLARGKIR